MNSKFTKTALSRVTKNSLFCLVLLAHAGAIYCLGKPQITPPKTTIQKPMFVSLITPAAPAPELVPLVEPPKPQEKIKTRPKKVVETIKPLETPTERLVEATTQPLPAEISPSPTQEVVQVAEAAAPQAPKPAVEEKIEPPKFGVAYLNNPAPHYPSASRRMGEEGRVLLRVLVSESGNAMDVQLEKTSGSNNLDEAAMDAVKNWRFIPAKKGNLALSAYVLVPIRFSLNS